MRPFGKTIPLEEARAIIERAIVPIDRTERVPLAATRTAACWPRTSSRPLDVPPFSRAAMDGYAVRAEDTTGASRTTPRTLRRIETIFTGQMSDRTGRRRRVHRDRDWRADARRRRRGRDGRGDRYRRPRLGVDLCRRPPRDRTSAGRAPTSRQVRRPAARRRAEREPRRRARGARPRPRSRSMRKPRVAILSTGNEIVDPGSRWRRGRSTTSTASRSPRVVADNGGVPDPLSHRRRHDRGSVARGGRVPRAGRAGVLGRQFGRRTRSHPRRGRAKGEMLFHGIAVKPGKPTAFGASAASSFFGMPGYPTSCLSNAYILLAPALRRIARLPEQIVRTLDAAARRARRVRPRPAPVLYGARREWRGRAGVQGLGRHHEHVAGRWLHRDSRRCRGSRGGHIRCRSRCSEGVGSRVIYFVDP